MPIYDFYCSDCRERFELLTSYATSAGEIACPNCQGSRVRKLFSVFATSGRASDSGEYGSYGEDAGYSGGCACGGACSCGGH